MIGRMTAGPQLKRGESVRPFIGRTLRTARVRILIAVCAALAAISGVLAAPAFAGGSAPGSGAPASGAAGSVTALSSPINQSGHASKSLLLINGDRLLINGKSTAVSLAGSGFPAALTELRIAGRHYVIPDVALPYLGRSLDLSLFDVAAQPGGATLPVWISYRGRTPRLPGVTITHAAGGAASGYLTARGAVSFAAALTRQFAADHAAASYGSDGLFAGQVWISARGVAGAAVTRAAAARQRAAQKATEPKTPAFKMHEVTLRGVTTNGKPDTGDLVFLFDAADNTIYGDPFEEPNAFYHGTARFSLPSGTYWALTWFTTTDKKGMPTGLRTVFVPRIAIKADATITLRAATASSKITFGTPKPSVLVLSSVQLAIADSRGSLSDFGLIQGPGFPVWLSPTAQRIPGGSLKEFVNVALQAPPGSAPAPDTDPDLYSGVFQDTSGLIHAQHFTLSAASLATVHAVYASDVDTTGGVQLAGFSTAELQTVGGGLAAIVAEQVPARITEHLLGGPGVFWENAYLQSLSTFGGGQTDAIRAFPAGADTAQDWNVYPLHTPLNSGEQAQVPGAQGFFGTPLSVSRTANELVLELNPFTDDTPGHVGTGFAQGAAGRIGTISGNYLIAVNGKQQQTGTIGGDEIFGTFFDGLTLPTAPSTVTLRLRASRTGALFPLSTAISDTWSWRSGNGLFDGLPPGWFCADGSTRCEVEPLLNFGYQVGGIALDGTTAAGAQQVTLTVGHQVLLPSPAAVTGVTAQFSLDNGTTWQPATVTGAGGTRTLAFAAPAGSYVSLKVSAADAAGGTLSETIIKAFATQTAVAAARETAAQRAAELVTQAGAAPASVTAASVTAASLTSAGTAAAPAAGTAGTAAAGGAPGYRAACAAPGPGRAQCFVLVAPEPGSSGANADGIAVTAKKPAGWGPRDIEHAYRLPVSRGSRATVAVVEAFDTPKLETYLNDYRREWGLGSCTTANGCFRKVGQAGSAKHLPASGVFSGWDLEATLDVDMVSAACPTCRILVVEANGQDFGQLSAGVKTAIRLGAVAVSNSYGGRETGQDLTDARAYNQPGHAIVVSTGDFGYSAASFPANLPTVTAAGGTELSKAANKRGWRETAWNTLGLGAGSSGCSAYVAKPSWQHDKNCPGRTVADVSAVAFNLAIYNKDWGGWTLVAGTSASSPIIGGIYGLAGNAAKVKPGYAYAHVKDLFDVVSGNNDWFFNAGGRSCGKDYLCVAKPGYDAPTGLGTPNGLGAF
jgi:hypothetical protein